jgi:hypothetical protein
MPVPRDRSDDAYFASLDQLKLAPESRLYLGLVHYTDGVEGGEAQDLGCTEGHSGFWHRD